MDKEKRFVQFLMKYSFILVMSFLGVYIGFPLLARVDGLPIWNIHLLILSTLIFTFLTLVLGLFAVIEYRSLRRGSEID
jgi:uncharacterized Tic20 family protein